MGWRRRGNIKLQGVRAEIATAWCMTKTNCGRGMRERGCIVVTGERGVGQEAPIGKGRGITSQETIGEAAEAMNGIRQEGREIGIGTGIKTVVGIVEAK